METFGPLALYINDVSKRGVAEHIAARCARPRVLSRLNLKLQSFFR